MKLSVFKYDAESFEGEILVKNTYGEFICYAYPFFGDINLINPNAFDVLLAKNIVISDELNYKIEKNSKSYFAYSICGIKTNDFTISVDNMDFALDTMLPKDVIIGQYIKFECLRIDAITTDCFKLKPHN